ncbi:hypothetical protein ASE00_15635 [Sphingomonas sp. Root710]|uniref:TetR/AcrR family transcriptional regulator n=1 Tax=Sphingomonas sp. Root710 TaxID=1736594 RepID=UPI0006FBE76D|nr:TetR/AcrR family transcriptional regulator [Sphingomonas sp. Root710]KRB81406.1 hypothetical protein ASE00_15635 [Sphingomonas sp. Root710]
MAKAPVKQTRPRDAEMTQARILDAAQIVFSQHGYGSSGVRDIAQLADVNPALVSRYFGGKEALFEKALEKTLNISPMMSVPLDRFGENLMRELHDDDANSVRSAAMFALSIGDPQAREISVELMRKKIIEPLAEAFASDDDSAGARARIVAILSLGYTVMRILVPMQEDEADQDAFVSKWLGEVLQDMAKPPQKS